MSHSDSWLSAIRSSTGGENRSSFSLNYPSQFLNYEKFLIPQTPWELFDLIRWAYLSDSNVRPAIENMSTYPVTEIEYVLEREVKEPAEQEKITKGWKTVMDDILDARLQCVSLCLDYHAFGIAFTSVYKPFTRFLVCEKCATAHNIHLSDTKWRWEDFKFLLSCIECKTTTKAKIKDEPRRGVAALKDVNLIKWNPNSIKLKKNLITGRRKISYKLPESVIKDIRDGDPEYLKYATVDFIEAVKAKMETGVEACVEFNPDSIYTMQSASLSMPESWEGWGLSRIMSSLRDLFSKVNMKRAQAMTLHEHTVPLRIFSPSSDDSSKPFLGTNAWKAEVVKGFNKWLKDPQTIITSPVPINVQQMGGDRGAMNLFAELQITNADIIKGMGVMKEFVEGSLSYSGGNVSIRMLENLFMDVVRKLNRYLNWLKDQISPMIDLEPVTMSLKKFKMADDIQQKQLLFSARQAKEVSHKTFSDILEIDSNSELQQIAKENMEIAYQNALAQTKSALSMQRVQEYSTRLNNALTNDIDSVIAPEVVTQYAQMISQQPHENQLLILENMKKTQPLLSGLVAKRLDLTPAGLQNELQKIMMTPDPYRQEALQDLMKTNPLISEMFSVMLQQHNQNNNQGMNSLNPLNTSGNTKPVNTNHIKPNPVQKPPRSMYKGI